MSGVSLEVAIKEVNSWLDYKKIRPKKREANQSQIDSLVEAVEYGTIIIDGKTFEMTQKLEFPVGENGSIKELVYQPRITVEQIDNRLKGVSNGDGDGRVRAHISALCGKGSGILKLLDSCDYSIPNAVVVFFV